MANISTYTNLQEADKFFEEGQALFQANPYNDYYEVFAKASIIYLEAQQWEKYLQCRFKMAFAEYKRKHFEKALESIEEIQTIYNQKIKEDTKLKGDLYDLLSMIYFDQWKYQKSLEAAETSLAIYQNIKDYKGIKNAYVGKGNVYNHTFRHREALLEYHKALKLIKSYGIKERGYEYYNMAIAYRLLNHNDLCQNYYLKGLHIFEKNAEKNFVIIANTKISLGELAAMGGEYEMAESFYEDALKIIGKNQGKYDLFAIAHIRMGEMYAAQNQWNKAQNFFQKAIDFQERESPNNYEWFSLTYNILAHLYKNNKQLEVAEEYFHKSLEANGKLEFNQDLFKANNYAGCAEVLQLANKLEKALDYIEKASHHQHIAQSQQGVNNQNLLLSLEIAKISIYYQHFKKVQAPEYLEKGLQLIPRIVALIEEVQIHIFQEADQINFNQNLNEFYQCATDLLYEQYLLKRDNEALKEIFTFSEKNKVHALLSNIQKVEALQLANIPQEELKKMQELQSKISNCKTELQKIKIDTNEKKVDEYAEELVQLQVSYHQLTQEMEENHPEYLTLKHQMPLADLKTIQSQLHFQTAAIAYTLTQSFIYIFCIEAEQITLKRVALPKDFSELIDTLIDEGTLGMNRKLYVEKAHQLYQVLIAPIQENLEANQIQSLLIFPDSQLLELPFEILLTQKTSFRTAYKSMPFLLKQYDLHYHYSATLRQYQRNRNAHRRHLPNRFLGFAPVYDEQYFPTAVSEELPVEATRDVSIRGKNYKALLYSEKEINEIEAKFQKKGWQAETFLRAEANLDSFKKKVVQNPSKFVHIAAHGVSNRKKNVLGILFSPTIGMGKKASKEKISKNPSNTPRQQETSTNTAKAILYAHEVYQLKLQSDLVFLSCCESGIGKIAAGEGILSINRGLLYAGASNIVFTLFKIYDQKTAVFVHHFYDFLLNQEDNYSKALRHAKLQLIVSNLAPKYWSGFLLLGD